MALYDEKFYKKTSVRRAILIRYTQKLYEMLAPKSVADIGCGASYTLEYLHGKGVKNLLGLDYSIDEAKKVIPRELHRYLGFCDVTKWLQGQWLWRKFDLAISWHMAEHVHTKFSDDIVNGLIRFSDTIHFSAAPPGQNGVNHINCQTVQWWEEKFADHGYVVDEKATKTWFMAMYEQYGLSRFGQGVRENARIFVRK